MNGAEAQKRNLKKNNSFWMIIRKGPNLMDEKGYALYILNKNNIHIGPGTIVYDMDLKNDQHYIAKILINVLKEKRILLDTSTSISFNPFIDESDCEGILLTAKIKGYVDEGIINEPYEVKKTYRKLKDLPNDTQTNSRKMNVHGFNVPERQAELIKPPMNISKPNNRINLMNAPSPSSTGITIRREENTSEDPLTNPYMETVVDNNYKEVFKKAKEKADWEKLAEKKEGCFIATAVYGSYDCSEVLYLRRIRDDVLYKSIGGRLFIKFYYFWSPFAAHLISKNGFVIRIFRKAIDALILYLKKKIRIV